VDVLCSAVQAQPLYDNVDGVTPVVTIAGYVAVAGSVVTAVSQAAIPKEEMWSLIPWIMTASGIIPRPQQKSQASSLQIGHR
jgi:hypothetical protein